MQYIDTPAGRLQIEEPAVQTSSVKYSRLYGYSGLLPVPEEQDVIRHVVETIAESVEPIEEVIAQLVDELNLKGVRIGSKRATRTKIIGLLRPIFGGRIKTPDGFVISEHYEPIVLWETMVAAMAKLN